MFERIKAAYDELVKPGIKTVETTEKEKKNLEEPWVEVVACGIDPIKGLQYELDWNQAFITYLRNSGYNGAADETIVGKWMVDLWKQTSDELNPPTNNEYQ